MSNKSPIEEKFAQLAEAIEKPFWDGALLLLEDGELPPKQHLAIGLKYNYPIPEIARKAIIGILTGDKKYARGGQKKSLTAYFRKRYYGAYVAVDAAFAEDDEKNNKKTPDRHRAICDYVADIFGIHWGTVEKAVHEYKKKLHP